MAPAKSSGTNDLSARFLCSSSAACIAEIFTFPIDTTRVRMQVACKQHKDHKLGMLATARGVLRDQGFRAFYAGIPPAMIRQFVQCGVNLAAYLPIRNALGADKDHSFVKKGLAGAISGAFGQFCAIPADIVKIRMQADNKALLEGGTKRYQGTVHAFTSVYQENGIRGLWRGATPSCGRSAAIHSSGLASYDSFKYILVAHMSMSSESSVTHFLASSASGFLASAVGCPFDVIKTRVMNQTASVSPYQMMVTTVQTEGLRSLFKGFVPTLARLGPWQVMWLSFYERFCIMYTGNSKF